MNFKNISMIALLGLLCACSSPAERMANCEAQGVSRDACYISEQNRQAEIEGAAMKQALENAREAAHTK